MNMTQTPLFPLILLTVYLLGTNPTFTQNANPLPESLRKYKPTSIGDLAKKISAESKKDSDRIALIYNWITDNIRYDVQQTNSLELSLSQATITEKAFKSRKAVCEGYAGLMDSLSVLVGIPTHLVNGYTLILDKIDPTPHVWVASYIEGKWMLSDPTWGSGTMVNNRFVKEYDPKFFLVKPEEMIKTHFPYDPLWQFMASPITHEAILNRKMNQRLTNYYLHHGDSLKRYSSASSVQQIDMELQRIQSLYVPHSALNERLNYLQNASNTNQYNQSIRLLNSIAQTFNQAVAAYNEYAVSHNQNQQNKRIKINTAQLVQAKILMEKCLQQLTENTYPENLIDQAQKVQKSVLELKAKIDSSR